ncbi:MAG: hypothetical protein KGD63_10500, partial [Candidatus Lokiarchaeota archaeon]|nr:hypothetical protein [Candidatus Lokiarchaeota archaeon]
LVILLGKIGKNQYKALPKKPFKKNNYPLPRDIIARTLTKIGVDALPFLMEILQNGSKTQISEAIDSIGYISYYSNDSSSLPCLWTCLEKYKDNKVIFWKIIRSFQSFQDDQVVIFLNYIKMNSKYQEIQWEAERSLKQIKFHNKK